MGPVTARLLECAGCRGIRSGGGFDGSDGTDARASWICRSPAGRRSFPPAVALHIVKMACELPDQRGRSLSTWDCVTIADQLVAEGIVGSISAQTVNRVLTHHKLKPWRVHMWLNPRTPRDDAFYQTITEIAELYTRQLEADEVVISADEKTSLQPRNRKAPTRAACPGRPVEVEHEYKRGGAAHLFAGFDTRTGQVYGYTARRKRAIEFIAFLEHLDAMIDAAKRRIYVVLDNVSYHKAKAVKAWLSAHPRFHLVFLPVHCSWMNQVEQWFSVLQRKRFKFSDFSSLDVVEARIHPFINEHNKHAHPYAWSTKSIARVMAKREEGTPVRAFA
jgi:transposase